MGHPNVDPRLSRICESQLMYRDMKVSQYIVITAEDAKTGQPGKIHLRVLSIRDDGNDATFQYLGDDFTFWLPEKRGLVQIEDGTLLEAGISANLIPRFIRKMIGVGGIGSIRDYLFDCVGGQYDRQIICHNIMRLETYFDEDETFDPPDLAEHLAKIEQTRKECEAKLAKDLPDKISLQADEILLQKLKRKLNEYRGRIDNFKHPRLQSKIFNKIAVLEYLLERGEIFPCEIREEIMNAVWFTSQDFNTACWVIEDYCQTGGANNRGGTGLK